MKEENINFLTYFPKKFKTGLQPCIPPIKSPSFPQKYNEILPHFRNKSLPRISIRRRSQNNTNFDYLKSSLVSFCSLPANFFPCSVFQLSHVGRLTVPFTSRGEESRRENCGEIPPLNPSCSNFLLTYFPHLLAFVPLN